MKILILCTNGITTAPGIVFKRLIAGLSTKHIIDLVTVDSKSFSDLHALNKIIAINETRIPTRLHKRIFTLFGINPFDLLWSKRVIRVLKNSNNMNYDLIFSFISYNHYAALICGKKIKNLNKIRHFVYSVDAIPAPIGWMKDDLFFEKTKKLITSLLFNADGIFLANRKMLEYQLNIVNPTNKIVTGVIYNPSFSKLQTLDFTGGEINTFLYTGAIYGPRKICYLLEAFQQILKEYPNSILEFVGSKLPEGSLNFLTESERSQVVIHPFTRDLAPFYARATALLDIDADLENDVFLSSKMTNYIAINRIIISQTGCNSPSRALFENIPSIIQCLHDNKMLANAMLSAIKLRDSMSFTDREEVLKLFELETVTEKINEEICK